MTRSISVAMLAAVLAAGVAACQPAPAIQRVDFPSALPAAAAVGTMYPLKAGATATYALTQYKDGQPTGRQDTMGSRVLSATETDGVTVAKVERTYGSTVLPPTRATVSAKSVVLARWDAAPSQANGLSDNFLPVPEAVRVVKANRPATENELTTSLQILSFPLTSSQSWTGRVWTFAKETLTAKGWERVTVPAGSIDAWHVVHTIAYDDGRTDNLGYWYAYGFGMVKAHEESAMIMGGQTVRYSVDGEQSAPVFNPGQYVSQPL